MNEDDIKAYAYIVEDSLTSPEIFELAIQQLAEMLGKSEAKIASILLGCYSCQNAEGSLKGFLQDWINDAIRN